MARRARVRQAVDCLDDLRTAPYAHIEFATNVSSWPALPRLRFLRALRELRGEPVLAPTLALPRRDARVNRWVEVYWPGDERWYRGRVTTQLGPLLRVFYNRPPARMDGGHALDGAPGARGSPELPTLIVTVTAEDLESISPLVRKAGRALSSLPCSPTKNSSFTYRYTEGRGLTTAAGPWGSCRSSSRTCPGRPPRARCASSARASTRPLAQPSPFLTWR